MEVVRLIDRISLAVEIGESHFREFKSAFEGKPGNKSPRSLKSISKDISETLVAFANADGGELLIGVEDDGKVTGLDFNEEGIERLLSVHKTHIHRDTPIPLPVAIKLNYQNKTILYFSVSKGVDFVFLTSDGRCLQRKDKESVPIASEQIKFSRTEKISIEYDRSFVDNADIADLDISLLQTVAEQVSRGMSVEKCLQHLELAEFDGDRLRLKKAALLLFAKNTNKWHPRLQVRLIKISGTEFQSGKDFNVLIDEECTSNILNLINLSWELLRPHLTETKFSKDAVFQTQTIYPELACKEALINAIAHRDYSVEGTGIEVRVFSDRLEIINPGALLSTLSINDLKELQGVHQSRNSLIAKVLREIGYMRELGEGMRRIHELMKSNDLTPPELHSDKNRFKIVLRHNFIYSKEIKIWLDNFKDCKLTKDEKTIVRLGYGNRRISPHQIWEEVGIVDTDYYRQLIESLRGKNILARAIERDKAYYLARKQDTSKKKIPQFQIQLPSSTPIIPSKNEPADESDYAKIFVGNIPFEVEEHDLIKVFQEFGEVVNVDIPINHETELKRGFAFVEFAENKSAETAIYKSGLINCQGRTLYVQKFNPEGENLNTKRKKDLAKEDFHQNKIFVPNIPNDSEEKEVFDAFQTFGEILDVYLPLDFETEKIKGFAFIKFAEEKSAKNAILNSGKISIGERKLTVLKAIKK